MKYIVLIAILFTVSYSINGYRFQSRAEDCKITYNPEFSADEIADKISNCVESTPEALSEFNLLNEKYKCVGTVKEIFRCILSTLCSTNDKDDIDQLGRILNLIKDCMIAAEVIVDPGNLTEEEFVLELLRCECNKLGSVR